MQLNIYKLELDIYSIIKSSFNTSVGEVVTPIGLYAIVSVPVTYVDYELPLKTTNFA